MATLLLRAAYPLARRPPPPRAASSRRRISTRASSSRPSLRRNRKGDGRGTDPFVSLHGCHTQGCCTNDLVASLEARAERAAGITRDGGIPLVEDVSLRECPDGDILSRHRTPRGGDTRRLPRRRYPLGVVRLLRLFPLF